MIWPQIFLELRAARDVILISLDHPKSKLLTHLLLRTLKSEDAIHERVQAGNDLYQISERRDFGVIGYKPVLCSHERDRRQRGPCPLLLPPLDPWIRLESKGDVEESRKIYTRLFLVSRSEAAGLMALSKRRCELELEPIPDLTSQARSYDGSMLRICIIQRMI